MKSSVETERGWLIELLPVKDGKVIGDWTPVGSRPIHKRRARNAAQLWQKDFKIKARIRQVEIATTTLAIEEQ
jgi:hypothetical protein